MAAVQGMRGMGAVMFQRHLLETGRDPHLVAFGSAAGAESTAYGRLLRGLVGVTMLQSEQK
eukprot:5822938-Amphidinium_carterae.1